MLNPKRGKTAATLRLTLAAILAVLVFGRFSHGRTMMAALAAAMVLPWVLAALLRRGLVRALAAALLAVSLAAPVVSGAVYLWGTNTKWASAPETLADRSAIFGGKNVLLLAPHGDDELNLAAGVIEEYIAAGSRVTVAFSTNGDAQVDADTRAREELAAAASLGIGADRVIFLGYDSGTAPGWPYLLEAAEPTLSLSGNSATHAVAGVSPWREGSPYTRAAFTEDIKSLLTTLWPDTVIACLADQEIDHKTLALCFEQAMGAALLENPGWQPTVLGAFAYASAWHAPDDYRSERLTASRDGGELAAYGRLRWEERLALPVAGQAVSILSPDLTSVASALSCHVSQDAILRAGRLVNADKVFFPRRCDSLLRDAALTASSGSAEAVRDWVLSDADTVFPLDRAEKNLWACDPEDEERSAVFTFAEPVTVAALSLWDCPDTARNTLRAVVSFDTGESVELIPDAAGRETSFVLPEPVACRALTLTLAEGTGEDWGLTEFAAYAAPEQRFPFFKLCDGEGNYLYDVLLPESGSASFTWSAYDMEVDAVSLEVDAPGCAVEYDAAGFTVTVAPGRSCVVTARDGSGRVLDSVRFSCPTKGTRFFIEHFDFFARCRPQAVWERCRELGHKLQIIVWGRLRYV